MFANQIGEKVSCFNVLFLHSYWAEHFSCLLVICSFSPVNRGLISFAWIPISCLSFSYCCMEGITYSICDPLLCMVWGFSASLWVILNCILSCIGIFHCEVDRLMRSLFSLFAFSVSPSFVSPVYIFLFFLSNVFIVLFHICVWSLPEITLGSSMKLKINFIFLPQQ